MLVELKAAVTGLDNRHPRLPRLPLAVVESVINVYG